MLNQINLVHTYHDKDGMNLALNDEIVSPIPDPQNSNPDGTGENPVYS